MGGAGRAWEHCLSLTVRVDNSKCLECPIRIAFLKKNMVDIAVSMINKRNKKVDELEHDKPQRKGSSTAGRVLGTSAA